MDVRARLDRAQESRLGGSVRQPLAGERRSPRGRTTSASRSRAASFCDASLQRQDLLPKFRLRQVRAMETHDGIRRGAEPPTCGRSRDAAIRGEAELARASDEFPESMVITLLPADCGGHAVIIADSLNAQGTRGLWQPDDRIASRGRLSSTG